MLKLDRVGQTAIEPFPVWPPVHQFRWESEPLLRLFLEKPSEAIRIRLADLRNDGERHGETVMRPLSSLYAHFYAYRDAPDLSGNSSSEFDLIRVKHILEREMIDHVFRLDVPVTSSFDDDQAKVADYVDALSSDNAGISHGLFDYIASDIDADGMREFLWLEIIRNEVVDDEVAMLVPGLQHSMKQVVASNLWDECGNSRIDGFHTTWLVRLLSHAQEWPDFMAYRSHRPWFSTCTSNSFNALLTTPGRNYAAYGTFLINESWVAEHFRRILAGMDRLGIHDEDRRIYFDKHYTIDQHHSAELIEAVRRQDPPLAQRELREVIVGAQQAICAGNLMYDKLLEYFRAR
jgi:hypothetical protein